MRARRSALSSGATTSRLRSVSELRINTFPSSTTIFAIGLLPVLEIDDVASSSVTLPAQTSSASDELDAVFSSIASGHGCSWKFVCVLEIAGQHLRREGERQPPRLSPSTTLKATLRCSPLMKQWRPHDRERQMPNKKGALLCAPFSLVTLDLTARYAAFSRSCASCGPSALSVRSVNGVASNSSLLATALRSGKLVHKISCNRRASIS